MKHIYVTEKTSGNWNKAIQVANTIKQKILSQEGLTASIGIASNKFVANGI